MHNDTTPSTLNNRFLPVANAVGLILALTANMLAVFLPLNNKTTGQLSDQYPNLFVPAGITFSIWSVIYLLLIAFVIYQLGSYSKSGKKQDAIKAVNQIGWWFFINCLANTAWIFSWHYEMVPLSVFIMFILLASLIVITLKGSIFTLREGWWRDLFVQIPFSIYLGWISIATIANISALLTFYSWDRWGMTEIKWTILMIQTGTILTILMIMRRNNLYFAMVVLWAFYGIILKRQEAAIPAENSIISICINAMIIIVVVGILKLAFFSKKPQVK